MLSRESFANMVSEQKRKDSHLIRIESSGGDHEPDSFQDDDDYSSSSLSSEVINNQLRPSRFIQPKSPHILLHQESLLSRNNDGLNHHQERLTSEISLASPTTTSAMILPQFHLKRLSQRVNSYLTAGNHNYSMRSPSMQNLDS